MKTKRKFLVLLVLMIVINTIGCPTESCGKVWRDQMGYAVWDPTDEPPATPLFE